MSMSITALKTTLLSEIELLGAEIQKQQEELNRQEDHCHTLQDKVWKLRNLKGDLENAVKGLSDNPVRPVELEETK